MNTTMNTTIAILTHPDTPPADRLFVPAGPTQSVEVIRHTYDCFEVVAYGLWGQVCRRRWYSFGSCHRRRAWAIEQAEQWARDLYLWFDGRIID
jgi:hypothetical protein